MNLSLLGKIRLVFQYIFSSFLSIETFILSLLLLVILLFNLKRPNYFVQVIAIGIYIGFLIGITIPYYQYVQLCIDSFFKVIIQYIYFPSPIVYFFIIMFVTVCMLFSIFSKKITSVKKCINYLFFSLLYFFFMSFISVASCEGIDLSNFVILYQNSLILSIVQISNFIFGIWILFTLFYYLYLFYQKKFD